MDNQNQENPVNAMTRKIGYLFVAVVVLLVVANLLSQQNSGRPEQRREDLLGRMQQSAGPWLERGEKVFDFAGGIFDAGAAYAEKTVESFNRQPNGE